MAMPEAIPDPLNTAFYRSLQAAEAALFAEAASAAGNAAQNRALESVARLRLGRLALVDSLAGLLTGASPAPVSDALAERVGLASVLRAVRVQAGALLATLGLEPAGLAHLLLGWCQRCRLDARATLLVFDCFRHHVLDAGSANGPASPGLAAAEAVLERGALLARLAVLQQTQAEALERALAAGQPLAAAGIGLAALNAALADAEPDPEAADILQRIALLFDFILLNARLPAAVRDLLACLQWPLLRVALTDTDFFARDGHPARALLNQMAAGSLGMEDAVTAADDSLLAAMQTAVRAVLAADVPDAGLFARVLAGLADAQAAEFEQALLAEERLRSAETAGAEAEALQARVRTALAAAAGTAPLPEAVAAFFAGSWTRVLFLALQQGGETGEKWPAYLQMAADLAWSVRPLAAADRQKLLRQVPGLLKSLRLALVWAGEPAAVLEQFFRDLETLHLGQLRGGAAAAAVPAVTSADAAVPVAESPATPAPDRAACLAQVERMGMGLWVEFSDGEERQRCKLAAVIRHTGRYIFVNRSGVKVAEKTREQLADDLAARRLRLIDETNLFDRALESVIAGQRKV